MTENSLSLTDEKKSSFTPTVLRILTFLIVIIYFFVFAFGFWYFEKSLLLRFLFLILALTTIVEYFIIKRILGFLLLTLYISLFSLLNILYTGLLAIWLVFIICLPLIIALVGLWKKTNRMSWRRSDTLLGILISLTLLEGLLTMSLLTFSPYMQAFILLIIPLTSMEIYSDYHNNILTPSRIIRYILAVTLAILIAFLTAPVGIQ